MFFNKIKLKHTLTDRKDALQVSDGLSVVVDIRGGYKHYMEKNVRNRGKEFPVTFKVYGDNNALICSKPAPLYVVPAGDVEISKKNRLEQQTALNEFLEKLPDEILQILEHAKQSVNYLERVLAEIDY